jgi:hypothetical protein
MSDTNPFDTPEAKLKYLRKDYEYAKERLKSNQKRMNKLLAKMYPLNSDRDFWLKEIQRCTQEMYELQFGDDDDG